MQVCLRPSRSGVVVVGVVATLSVSFTASTKVPASFAGTSLQPPRVAQLVPAGCDGLNLTSLVQGSGTFTTAASRPLILGSASADRLTSSGSYSCIVAGGGSDSMTGSATDICVTGPTAGTAGACASLANGVTATLPRATPTSTTAVQRGWSSRTLQRLLHFA